MATGKWQPWCEPENLLRITNWAANGCTNDELARNMGIARSTLALWVERHSVISDAIKDGRAMSCQAIENALFKTAMGYDVDEVTTVEEFKGEIRDGKPAEGTISRKESVHRRHIPGNPAAQIFYLKNRVASRYSDRRVVEQADAAPQLVLGVTPGRAADD